jgi:hypothetical protein
VIRGQKIRGQKFVSIDVNFRFSGAQKNFKKNQKKACQPLTCSLNGGLTRQMGREGRSKKL